VSSGDGAAGCRRGFSPCQPNGGFERLCVELHFRGLYCQKVAVDKEEGPFFSVMDLLFLHALLEFGHDSAQVCAGVPLVALWPQKLC
jgi:hypothetical protein